MRAYSHDLVDTFVHRLGTEELRNSQIEGMVEVIRMRADAALAARVFAKVRDQRRTLDAEPGKVHDFERQVTRQMEALFRRLPDNLVATGVLSSVTQGDPLDIKVAADLLSRVARSDLEPMRVTDEDLRERLRAYLKGGVGLVLCQDDFAGEEKANLASAIAQVGRAQDMADLVALVDADIERMRRGRAARAAGDLGPLAHGGSVSYARWNIAAVQHLDPAGAEPVLIDLLSEPEYATDAAEAMACDFVPKPERFFDREFRYDLMWAPAKVRRRLLVMTIGVRGSPLPSMTRSGACETVAWTGNTQPLTYRSQRHLPRLTAGTPRQWYLTQSPCPTDGSNTPVLMQRSAC